MLPVIPSRICFPFNILFSCLWLMALMAKSPQKLLLALAEVDLVVEILFGSNNYRLWKALVVA